MTQDKTNKVLNVPPLRFPEFTEEWEKCIFADICKITTGNKNTQDKEDNGIYPFYVRSQQIERINSYTFDGEAVLTAGDGVGVGKVFHYSKGKIGVHQRVYILCNFIGVGKYIYYYFTKNFYNRVKRMSAKNSVDSVRYDMIAQMSIYMPSVPEQDKIASLLTTVDQRIETQIRVIDKLESLIKGIVVTHFSNVPNKQVITIADLGEAYSVGNLSKEDLSVEGEPCILYGELFTTYGCVAQCITSKTNKFEQATLSKINDLLFPASTTVDAVSLIAPTSIQTDGVYVAGDLFGIHVSNKYNSQYISYLLNYVYKKELAKYAQGSTIIHLHYDDIKNAQISVPTLLEQNKCSQLLSLQQKKLTAERSLLNMYQVQKAYLLQNMFI